MKMSIPLVDKLNGSIHVGARQPPQNWWRL